MFATGIGGESLPSKDLLHLLARRQIRTTPATAGAGLVVHRDLVLRDVDIRGLPTGMTVAGSLSIVRCSITVLPAGLTVRDDLTIFKTHIACLPEWLHVGQDLSMDTVRIATLPDSISVGRHLAWNNSHVVSMPRGLRILGNLDLMLSRIDALPDDLHVHGHLYLKNATLHRFPPGLQVGGTLVPPTGLDDGAAFMASKAEATLAPPRSAHERMRMHAELGPDLARIVLGMHPEHQLRLYTTESGVRIAVEHRPGRTR